MQAAVVIPVKAFHAAKLRLAPALTPARRADLARQMATSVVLATGDLTVVVVCDDEEVRGWAEDLGALVHWTPGLGLDGAVRAGVDAVARAGFERAVIAHGDLPLATDLGHVVGHHGVVIVPDRRAEGTNVLALPTSAPFRFAYGPGSFARHCAEATRLGLPVDVREDLALGWDVDIPDDLMLPAGSVVPARLAANLDTTGD